MGIPLPYITKILIKFHDFCLNHYCVVLSTFLMIIFYIIMLKYNPSFKKQKDRILSNIPILKDFRHDLDIIKFFSFMKTMLFESMTIRESLDLAIIAFEDSSSMKSAIHKIRSFIMSGLSLSISMRKTGIFDISHILIIEAGEKVSSLPDSFLLLSTDLQNDFIHKIERYTNLIQPFIIIFMGGLIMTIVYSVLIPMYDSIKF